ncbi:archease [Candidatus Peregrinibacteria bacterium]|nr:archease [Candidatus Peregrinibacteria bacterium]
MSQFLNFKYLPHTADAKFQAFGETFEQALQNAGRAMTNLITDVSKIKSREKYKINITSPSTEDLVVDFLNELLFLLETKGFLMQDAELKINKNALTGVLCGDSVKNYEMHGHVKAATYNDLKIARKNGKWMIQVVADV